ncbi:metallophosphoesterase [bacterium]|nr:metallophosphoesterase [bacterium]
MRIVHMADAHLGFSSYGKFDGNKNIREYDFYRAFVTACEKARELNPDVVVIAGDLFHVRRPPAQAIAVAQSALALFECPIIVVAGNHDNSIHRVSSPLVTLSLLRNVVLFEQPSLYEVRGSYFYCVPYTESPPNFLEADYLVGHLRDRRVPKFKDSAIEVPDKYKIAMLGDLHMPFEVSQNTFYAGALERVSFNQLGVPCGFTFYSDGTARSRTFVEIETRPFVELTKPPEDLEMVRNAVVRCVIPSSASLDWVNQVRKVALHVTVRITDEVDVKDDLERDLPIVGSILDSFREFCQANKTKYSPAAIKLAIETLEEKSLGGKSS